MADKFGVWTYIQSVSFLISYADNTLFDWEERNNKEATLHMKRDLLYTNKLMINMHATISDSCL